MLPMRMSRSGETPGRSRAPPARGAPSSLRWTPQASLRPLRTLAGCGGRAVACHLPSRRAPARPHPFWARGYLRVPGSAGQLPGAGRGVTRTAGNERGTAAATPQLCASAHRSHRRSRPRSVERVDRPRPLPHKPRRPSRGGVGPRSVLRVDKLLPHDSEPGRGRQGRSRATERPESISSSHTSQNPKEVVVRAESGPETSTESIGSAHSSQNPEETVRGRSQIT